MRTLINILMLCAIPFAAAQAAHGQVLTVTVTDPHAGSSVCWVAPHTLECICPAITSDYYGEPAAELAHLPRTTGCAPNWVVGLWETDVGVTASGNVGLNQSVSADWDLVDIVASIEFRGSGEGPFAPGTPLKPFSFMDPTPSFVVAGEMIAFTCCEQEQSSGVGDAWFTLTFRMLGDHNADGVCTVPDLFAFLSEWFAQIPRADAEADGDVDVPDIFAFLSAWFAGE